MSRIDLHLTRCLQLFGCDCPFSEARYAVVGVPLDLTATYRPGARFGPRAVREASLSLESFCPRSGLDINDLKICDLGDLRTVGSIDKTLGMLEGVVAEIVSEGKLPVLIGGEHTLTISAVKALKKKPMVLCFDAHMDFRDEFLGVRFSHATVMRRVAQLVGVDRVVEVGVRAFSRDEYDYARRAGLRVVSSRDVVKMGVSRVSRSLSRIVGSDGVYVSIDMDVLDPCYAPAVGNPEPEGLSPTTLLEIIAMLSKLPVVGLDVVEVAPIYDTGQTAIQAAHTVGEVLCLLERQLR